MGEEHIIELLDTRPLNDLRESELFRVKEHTAICARCSHAFQAAQLSNLLLRRRAELEIEQSPFFQTNLMAAIKDEQIQIGPFSFLRIWSEANRLIYSMAALTIILGLITLFQTKSNSANLRLSTVDPLEFIVYGTDSTLDELSYGQVWMDLYASPSEKGSTERNQQNN
jgi:hypothetical protein